MSLMYEDIYLCIALQLLRSGRDWVLKVNRSTDKPQFNRGSTRFYLWRSVTVNSRLNRGYGQSVLVPIWALDVTQSWVLVRGSAFKRWENGLGGLGGLTSVLPSSVCLGYPCWASPMLCHGHLVLVELMHAGDVAVGWTCRRLWCW